MVPPQCGWGRTAFGSTHEPRSTHNPPAGPPRTVSTRGPGRSSRIPAPSQRPDGAGPDRGQVSVNKFPEGFPGCRVFGLPGQGSGLPSLSRGQNPPSTAWGATGACFYPYRSRASFPIGCRRSQRRWLSVQALFLSSLEQSHHVLDQALLKVCCSPSCHDHCMLACTLRYNGLGRLTKPTSP